VGVVRSFRDIPAICRPNGAEQHQSRQHFFPPCCTCGPPCDHFSTLKVCFGRFDALTNAYDLKPDIDDPSLDHFVGAGEQLRRHGEAKRFRCFKIDHQFNFGALLDREVTRLGAPENFSDIDSCLVV
jgi:hypothetical protein